MTNVEKFVEVFGFEPDYSCVIPEWVCMDQEAMCKTCPFYEWWNKEYKSCFVLKEKPNDNEDY